MSPRDYRLGYVDYYRGYTQPATALNSWTASVDTKPRHPEPLRPRTAVEVLFGDVERVCARGRIAA